MRVETRRGHSCNRAERRDDCLRHRTAPPKSTPLQRLTTPTRQNQYGFIPDPIPVNDATQRHARLATAARFYITKRYTQGPTSAYAQPRQRDARVLGTSVSKGKHGTAARRRSRAGRQPKQPAERQGKKGSQEGVDAHNDERRPS
ncbi:hypothetical protein [Burkholderia sp. Ac-20379]|uniref:hypothetical protein n=1 Tax=Burkholderia sp. Ac-20379 TaxID=2703900 RepID=UPI001980F793|nr:hypothetical protein [Burkholderia sp. Ac-20379]MBN3726484.1 hypothetical protein [Burkholderia sp. Ac-20379]